MDHMEFGEFFERLQMFVGAGSMVQQSYQRDHVGPMGSLLKGYLASYKKEVWTTEDVCRVIFQVSFRFLCSFEPR